MGGRGTKIWGWIVEAGMPAAEVFELSPGDLAYRQTIEQALNPAPLRPMNYETIPEAAAWMIERARGLEADINSGVLDVSLHPPDWVSAVFTLATIDDDSIPSFGRGTRGGITY